MIGIHNNPYYPAMSRPLWDSYRRLGYGGNPHPPVDIESFKLALKDAEAAPVPDKEVAIINRVYNFFPDELPECMKSCLLPNGN